MPRQNQHGLEPQVLTSLKYEEDATGKVGKAQETIPRSSYDRQRPKPRKTLVLCFDGTGNRFHGDASDSNILKIFRMLDRSGSAYHYYQPGIGTYVTSDLSNHSSFQKLREWYLKAMDSAVGSSFDQHVVGGYKFLMNHYSPGDNIYMFGFSRGSYTARFLAEMIDWVGLITHGNEEMIQFAWRTFSKWKAIDSYSGEAMRRQEKAYNFMVSFRETFSRPVRRIRFLGLFDTVNSVPRFENAMMSRPYMPYTAKSSAKVIRHAVSIDERRAKFRSDLISEEGQLKEETDKAKAKHLAEKAEKVKRFAQPRTQYNKPSKKADRIETMTRTEMMNGNRRKSSHKVSLTPLRYRARGKSRSPERGGQNSFESSVERVEIKDDQSLVSNCRRSFALSAPFDLEYSSDSEGSDQDIDELWFPGGHADIGGGWTDANEEEIALSHVPLVWIVREASKSGLIFDEEKMKAMGCLDDQEEELTIAAANLPTIEISNTAGSAEVFPPSAGEKATNTKTKISEFKDKLIKAATEGRKHDCLAFGEGLPHASVFSWRLMEYIPFRRMDLRDDGSWAPIRWPLPRGEVRDMPANAKVHHSAIRRMQHNPSYRPGNLILGGGGRGRKTAPKEAGIGSWQVVGEEGDIIGERYVRVPQPAAG